MSPRLRRIIETDEVDEPRQLGFFGTDIDSMESPESSLDSPERRDLLARQTKTVLLMRLIPLLGENRHVNPRWRPYDYSVLQLRAIRHVVDKMGPMDEGITTGALLQRVADWAGEMTPQQPRVEHEEVAQDVLNWLLGMGPAATFAPEFLAYGDTGQVERRQMNPVRFLLPRPRSDKGVYLRASIEAINLLLGVLAEDIADAHKSAERVWQEHLKEKRYERACFQADTARLRSIQYAQEVRGWIFGARQDITKFDMASVQTRYREALTHIRERVLSEGEMKQIIADNMADEKNPSRETESQVARISALLEDCFRRHAFLEEELMEATATFSHEGRQQLFAAPSASHLALGTGFEATLELPLTEALRLDTLFSAVAGPVAPMVVDLWDLVSILAAPGKEPNPQPLEPETPDLIDAPPISRFPPEAIFAAYSALQSALASPTTLSDLLGTARREAPGCPDLAAELLRLLALQVFAPGKAEEDNFVSSLVSELNGAVLDDPDYYGDELLVGTEEEVRNRPAQAPANTEPI